ncbi:acetylserotonin O-methyltransferase [Kribbella sp. NBC_01505]|uniref:methyltransferase n=1 Tax=Kribbella sp. NBC_01505 TaxID=2903580 RepID=UPI00386A422A
MTTAPPGTQLRQLTFGFMPAYVVRAAAQLGIVDAFAGVPRPAKEVAAELGLPVDSTRRLLRALTALGLFAEQQDDHFEVLPEADLLGREHPASVQAIVAMFTDPLMTRGWEELATAVRTGHTTFDDIFGQPFFDQLAEEPVKSALFNASMSEATRGVAATAPSAYDFGRFTSVLDIGGGDGTLLTAILQANPNLRGAVLDSAEGAAQAPARYAEAGLTDRATVVTGDFFDAIPDGYDLHLIKSIIHDWSDDRCEQILRLSRAAIPADGRLVIVEPILPDRAEPGLRPGLYLSDLNMLVNVGGRERTRADFDALLQRSGFSLTAIHALPPEVGFWLIEATPV